MLHADPLGHGIHAPGNLSPRPRRRPPPRAGTDVSDGRDAHGREAVVRLLPDPDLRDPLEVERRLRGVQVVLVEHAVERRREEDEGRALLGLDREAQLAEGRAAAPATSFRYTSTVATLCPPFCANLRPSGDEVSKAS